MSYVDEYRDMVSTSNVVFSSDPDVQVFSYPAVDYSSEVWQTGYDYVDFDDEDWRENDCAG